MVNFKTEITLAGTVESINTREDLTFISDSQEVEEIKRYFGIEKDDTLHSFFVKAVNGDYEEVYGIGGIIPDLNKTLWKIALIEQKPQYLEVIWTKKHLLKNRSFTLEKKTQAYSFFERLSSNDVQICLRGRGYEPSFTTRDLERGFDLWIYGTKEQRLNKFLEWLNEQLEITKED